jgi:hypothetical protein
VAEIRQRFPWLWRKAYEARRGVGFTRLRPGLAGFAGCGAAGGLLDGVTRRAGAAAPMAWWSRFLLAVPPDPNLTTR